jgi:hypothetical protein
MGRNPLAQARVEPATKSAIEDYAERHDLSQSEATRKLIQDGLAREGYRTDGTQSPLARLASRATVLFGTVLLALAMAALGIASTGTLGPLSAGVGVVLLLTGTLTIWTAVLAQIALAQPLRGLLFQSEVKA